tara:strand:+ start:44363 stop:45058 length:696 start_codon:yes stop_codon:yes gene_type:complete
MIDELNLDEVYWAQDGYNPELDMSYDRRRDYRTDEDFGNDMVKSFHTESYAADRFMEVLEKYSPYKILGHKLLVSPKVDKSGSFRDKGDLLVDFEVNGQTQTVVFDMKAVPRVTNSGRSTEHNKRFRMNMDSHNGMIDKKHVGVPMIGTTYDCERINLFVSADLEDVGPRISMNNYPKLGSYTNPGGQTKYYYDIEESDRIFDLPWFSMTDPNPSDDSIENFREMIRRAVE